MMDGGNMFQPIDDLNSTKHRPRWRSNRRHAFRRTMKKRTRAKAKTKLHNGGEDDNG